MAVDLQVLLAMKHEKPVQLLIMLRAGVFSCEVRFKLINKRQNFKPLMPRQIEQRVKECACKTMNWSVWKENAHLSIMYLDAQDVSHFPQKVLEFVVGTAVETTELTMFTRKREKTCCCGLTSETCQRA